MAFIKGDNAANTLNDNPLQNDTIAALGGDDTINVTGGVDTVTGGNGADTLNVDLSAASVIADMGAGFDIVNPSWAGVSQLRLMFTSSQVGNGNVNDSGDMTNQDGGLAVRLQAEDAGGSLAGPVSRLDDEGIIFVAAAGTTFDVRDLVSGVARGDQFEVAVLGTNVRDELTAVQAAKAYYFNAGQGNDSITGGTAADFLVGGAGDDSLNGGAGGNDSFIGGGGNDTIQGNDNVNTIAAFNITTDGPDVVNLGGGNDIFNVSATAPTNVRLSFTSSQVGNGNVNDSGDMANQDGGLAVRLQAEDGSDGLTGAVTRTDDEGMVFVAGAGVTFDIRDLVSGVARGNLFEVAVLGTNAADTLTAVQAARPYYFNAGMGDDTVTGGSGADFLVGGAGNDTLDGGTNNDSFIGGGGNDTIAGGADANIVAAFNVTTDGADSVNLGGGDDIFNVSATAPTNVRLSFTSSQVGNGNVNDSGDMANQDGGLAVRLQAEDGAGALTGGVTRTDDEGMIFVAGAGVTFDIRDLVSGVARGDQFEVAVLGTSGDDELTAVQAARPYYFNAGMGADSVTGGSASDFLVGGAGDDSLNGGASGNDSFIGGGGNDTIQGNDDVNTIAAFNITTDGPDVVNLAGGLDIFNVSATAPTNVRLSFTSSQVGNGNAQDSGDMANQDGGLAVRLQAEDGAGNLAGALSRTDDEGMVFVAGTGVTFDIRDLVSGVARGDQFEVAVLGTGGDDTLTAVQAARPYYFNAGMGNDTVTGGDSNDFLVGGAGNDGLAGGLGNDSFIGGAGTDTLTGGDGDDVYIDATGDSIVEAVGGGANDRVQSVVSYNLASAPNVEDITLTGTANINAIGNNAGNILTGNAGNNTLIGSGGNDVLTGADGADTLNGGTGNDVYIAPTAADTIVEAAGAAGGQHDRIQTLASFNLNTVSNVEDITLAGGANVNAIGDNFANILTGNSGNNILIGGGGDDIITGGAGNDTMNAGPDKDLFRFATSNTGDDTINTFQVDCDTFDLSGGSFSNRSENGGNTTLTHAGGTVVISGIVGLSLADWNALVVGGAREAPATARGYDGAMHDDSTALQTAAHADFLFG